MPIATTCDNCASPLNAPDNTAGRRVRCPKCQQPTSIPTQNAPPVPPPIPSRQQSKKQNVATAFCTNCGDPVAPKAIACTHCGVPPTIEKHFCHHCGADTHSKQVVCVKCGSAISNTSASVSGEKNKVVAGVLALCLGGLGAHKFYHGSWGWGIIYLVFVLTFIPAIVSCVEAIVLLCMNASAYDAKYNQQAAHPFKW